jgi:hypothetical protein
MLYERTLREIRPINQEHGMDIVVLCEGNRNSKNIPDFFNITLFHNNIITIIFIKKGTSFCDIMIYYHEITNVSFQHKTFLESLWFGTDSNFFVLFVHSKIDSAVTSEDQAKLTHFTYFHLPLPEARLSISTFLLFTYTC